MRAWWGALSLRARLAFAFGAMAADALIFLLAIVARTLGTTALAQGKILPAAVFALAIFFLGGWFVAAWCLREIGKLAARSSETSDAHEKPPIPAELEGLATLLRREAERRDRLLGELQRFTADAAHELRTPLTALRTTGEVALRRASLGRASDCDTLREAMGTMLEEAAAMSALLERLLRLARLENQAVQLRSVALVDHLASWRDGLHVLAEEKQITVKIDYPSNGGTAPLHVVTDPTLLGHAVTNLLHNAIQHSPPNSTVSLSIRAATGSEEISIVVGDKGPGIAPENQARVFERFYRISRPHAQTGNGHGLGLCIAKAAIERLGGQLTLRSALGSGAEFTITLPLNLTKS